MAERNAPVTEIAQLFPLQGEWTEHDYFNLPDAARIIELSDGELIMPPPPSDAHQYAVMELAVALRAYVLEHDLGTVRFAPLAVRLWGGKIREPDVLFVSKEHADRVGEQVYGVPDWVAEVIPPGTRHTDEVEKLAEYREAGVAEYWLVDPETRTIRVYVLGESSHDEPITYGPGQRARSLIIQGFEVAVGKIV
jgi:Uma2 family endonuclease